MTRHNLEKILEPVKIGQMSLSHRAILAPLTRHRAVDNTPGERFVEYYTQRASSPPGGLVITEATCITPQGAGYGSTVPGIWNKEQISQWKKVTDGVHAQGSYIYMQLIALGWAADPELMQKDGYDYVSASNQSPDDSDVKARALTTEEVKQYVKDFAKAAENAIEAGFDGVEIHSANGYLLNQFICEYSNHRTDEYGGSIENRSRFSLEVVDAITEAIGADRLGIRFSPNGTFNSMDDGVSAYPQYTHLLAELEKRAQNDPSKRLAFVDMIEPRIKGNTTVTTSNDIESINDVATQIWKGVLIRCGCLAHDVELLTHVLNQPNTVPAFGRYFISNPDLPERLARGYDLTKYNRGTFYTPGDEGYIDYPAAVAKA